ncbi:MAG: cysteine--tRNA ligase [Candidatus Latescibacteria bacterium]|nr:cysteine--tRNA ligase [bacterium]MBD3423490.1 cysteine--tRNA ligase [Candidatus Latescibacterota bacterium]
MALRVYNRFTGRKEEFNPVDDNRVGIYFCGITVQGEPHMGHMLAFVSADVIRRYLIFKGYNVTYVQNFTDVDDKIIAKANEEGIEPAELAERNIKSYFQASDLLNIKRADIYPKATEHIDDIINLIKTLEEKGFAYERGGDVYYRVRKCDEYGKLSGRKIDDLQVGARIAEGENKEDPLDFTLWKAAKEGEPYWDSPWGKGRPGWHIECSAMSMKYLGKTLDMHGGGEDLVFPHHENEIAQSEAATGQHFVNYWMHNGLLNLEGEKMSKSTSHFFSITEVNEEFSGEVIRFYLISTHFRSRSEFSRKRLEEAEAGLDRIRNMCLYLDECAGGEETGEENGPATKLENLAAETESRFMEAMDDDFNSAEAIGHIFHLVREFNRIRSMPEFDLAAHPETARKLLAAMGKFNEILGMFKEGLPAAELEIPAGVMRLVTERDEARQQKDWEKADILRDKIQKMGYVLEDGPDGARVKKDK